MSLPRFDESPDSADIPRIGSELFADVTALHPICRSITGDGVRESLRHLQRRVPLEIKEVPTGTKVFDWEVPEEWNIRDAFIKGPAGDKIVDFKKSNLHVVNYSVPVAARMTLAELRPHLHSLAQQPDLVPYRTSYYKRTWGFCVSQRQLDAMKDGEYEVLIDSTLAPGSLSYGEFRIQGAVDDEVLISAHSCHPSLCNDNLSGMVVAAKLAQLLASASPRYSYRFLWIPGTIGSIAWLARNERVLPKIKHGLVLSCVGDRGSFTYKRSRRENAEIDQAVELVLRHAAEGGRAVDFSPIGYDERQYCSPGINLAVGCFMRTPNGKFPEYHTSGDNLDFVSDRALAGSLMRLLEVIRVLEGNRRFRNLNPKCEPQLGRRGLYRATGGLSNSRLEEALLWVLNLSDGEHTLLEVAKRSGMPFGLIDEARELLERVGLLSE